MLSANGSGSLPMNRVERHAEDVRANLRLPADLPGIDALDSLAGWLRGRVQVEESPACFGFCIHHADGTATIWAAPGERRAASMLHEICHVTWWNGLGRFLQEQDSPVARTQRWREEYACDRFARAFLLPRALVHAYPDDHELAEIASCPLDMVRLRRRELGEQ